MRGLAWDDEVGKQSYVSHLRTALAAEPFRVTLELEKDANRFLERFNQDVWDFVITDLQGKDVAQELEPGLSIARRLAHRVPLFVVTNYPDRLDREKRRIHASVVIK